MKEILVKDKQLSVTSEKEGKSYVVNTNRDHLLPQQRGTGLCTKQLDIFVHGINDVLGSAV